MSEIEGKNLNKPTPKTWLMGRVKYINLSFNEVERDVAMGCRIGPSLSYFSYQPVLHDWCIKGHGICYPVCWMVHIKEPLLLIGKSSSCHGGAGFLSGYLNGPLPLCPT